MFERRGFAGHGQIRGRGGRSGVAIAGCLLVRDFCVCPHERRKPAPPGGGDGRQPNHAALQCPRKAPTRGPTPELTLRALSQLQDCTAFLPAAARSRTPKRGYKTGKRATGERNASEHPPLAQLRPRKVTEVPPSPVPLSYPLFSNSSLCMMHRVNEEARSPTAREPCGIAAGSAARGLEARSTRRCRGVT